MIGMKGMRMRASVRGNETLQWIDKVFEIQELVDRKAELALKVAEQFALNLSSDRGRDLSTHNRDLHGGHFDSDYALKCQRAYREELAKLRKEYDEVSEQIKRLQAEIKEAIYEPVGA